MITIFSEAEAKKAITDIIANTSDIKDPMNFARSIVKINAIKKVNETITACDDCKIGASVKTIGYGNPNASVMMICDYPIDQQIKLNKECVVPFEGTKYFDSFEMMFNQLGINKDEIFWMNSMQCYPKLNGIYRCPYSYEIKKCSVYMKYMVDVIHPSMIILLGSVALSCFKKVPMNDIHGTWIDAFTIPAMPTYSPSYIDQLEKLDYDPDKIKYLKNAMCKDITTAFEYLRKKYPYNNVTNKEGVIQI